MPDHTQSLIVDVPLDDAPTPVIATPVSKYDTSKSPSMSQIYSDKSWRDGLALPQAEPSGPSLGKTLPPLTAAEMAAHTDAERIASIRRATAQAEAEHQQIMAAERVETAQARYDAIINCLSALDSRIEEANNRADHARQIGDVSNASYWQGEASKLQAQYTQLNDDYDRIDESQLQAPTPSRQPTVSDIVETNAVGAEKPWLYAHPDLLQSEAGVTRLRGAAMNAMGRGLQRGTDAFVRDVEGQLYGTQYRQGHSEPRQSTKVTLSADDRVMAKRLGVDERTWARGIIERERRKSLGMYQE
jgi:hypothetical protein